MTTGRANVRKGETERLAVADWYATAGLVVINFSQPGLPRGRRGRRGTFQTPGIPDLLVLDLHGVGHRAFWHEVKAGKARVSPAQRELHANLVAAGMRVVVGDREAAKGELRRRGYLVLRDGIEVLEPSRPNALQLPETATAWTGSVTPVLQGMHGRPIIRQPDGSYDEAPETWTGPEPIP